MRHLVIGLLLAVLAPSAPAFAQVMTAEEVAGPMQALVGKEYSGRLKVVSIAAEGNVLVLTIDGQAGWHGITPKQAVESFLAPFCADEDGRAFLKANMVRLDRLDRGANLERGEPTNSCPAKPAD